MMRFLFLAIIGAIYLTGCAGTNPDEINSPDLLEDAFIEEQNRAIRQLGY